MGAALTQSTAPPVLTPWFAARQQVVLSVSASSRCSRCAARPCTPWCTGRFGEPCGRCCSACRSRCSSVPGRAGLVGLGARRHRPALHDDRRGRRDVADGRAAPARRAFALTGGLAGRRQRGHRRTRNPRFRGALGGARRPLRSHHGRHRPAPARPRRIAVAPGCRVGAAARRDVGALIVSKAVIVLVALDSARSAREAPAGRRTGITGAALLGLAAFMPYVLLRLVPGDRGCRRLAPRIGPRTAPPASRDAPSPGRLDGARRRGRLRRAVGRRGRDQPDRHAPGPRTWTSSRGRRSIPTRRSSVAARRSPRSRHRRARTSSSATPSDPCSGGSPEGLLVSDRAYRLGRPEVRGAVFGWRPGQARVRRLGAVTCVSLCNLGGPATTASGCRPPRGRARLRWFPCADGGGPVGTDRRDVPARPPPGAVVRRGGGALACGRRGRWAP